MNALSNLTSSRHPVRGLFPSEKKLERHRLSASAVSDLDVCEDALFQKAGVADVADEALTCLLIPSFKRLDVPVLYCIATINMLLRFHTSWLFWTLLLLPNGKNEAVGAFSGSSGEVLPSNAMWRVSTSVGRTFQGSRTRLFAKPERLQEISVAVSGGLLISSPY
jgi:hypothetical protein